LDREQPTNGSNRTNPGTMISVAANGFGFRSCPKGRRTPVEVVSVDRVIQQDPKRVVKMIKNGAGIAAEWG